MSSGQEIAEDVGEHNLSGDLMDSYQGRFQNPNNRRTDDRNANDSVSSSSSSAFQSSDGGKALPKTKLVLPKTEMKKGGSKDICSQGIKLDPQQPLRSSTNKKAKALIDIKDLKGSIHVNGMQDKLAGAYEP